MLNLDCLAKFVSLGVVDIKNAGWTRLYWLCSPLGLTDQSVNLMGLGFSVSAVAKFEKLCTSSYFFDTRLK